MKKNGFTLPELLAVIAIIAIIALIAIPSVLLIRNKINKRLYESKKETILLAAQLYGQDNEDIFNVTGEAMIDVGLLIQKNYIEKDIEYDGDICGDLYGCVINPINQTSLNNIEILIKKTQTTIIAIWQGQEGSSAERELVDVVLEDLDCTPTVNSPCLYTGEESNNYLSYSGIMWRILGVYVIDGQNVVKLITNNNIPID